MILRRFALFAVLPLLLGCANSLDVDSITKAAMVQPVVGKTRISFVRSLDEMIGATAELSINGQKVAELSRGQAYAAIFEPGEIEVSLDCPFWACYLRPPSKLHFRAEPNINYNFVIITRPELVKLPPGSQPEKESGLSMFWATFTRVTPVEVHTP